MSILKPKVTASPSQAGPVANDIVNMIHNQITSGQFGTGFGPMQRDAGTAIQQYVNSGGGQFDNTDMFKGMEASFNKSVDTQAQDLRDSFAAIGGRFGNGLATAEGNMRGEAAADFAAKKGDILRQEYDSQQTRLLNAIGAMFGMGEANTAPAFNVANKGIAQSETVVQPSGLSQLMGWIQSGMNIFSGAKDIFGNKGGSGPTTPSLGFPGGTQTTQTWKPPVIRVPNGNPTY